MNENFEVYKCNILATDYPDALPPVKLLESGDEFFMTCDRKYKMGDNYMNNKFVISDIYYQHHKWWQFWKRKKIIGYAVTVK